MYCALKDDTIIIIIIIMVVFLEGVLFDVYTIHQPSNIVIVKGVLFIWIDQ